jgi:hypothetical protein
LTAAGDGRVIGGLGKGLVVERMMVRLMSPKIGDVVRVRSCELCFYLPNGLPEYTDTLLVGRVPGRYIAHAVGRDWNIATQCVEHEEEMLLGGRWLLSASAIVEIDRANILEPFAHCPPCRACSGLQPYRKCAPPGA